jgi:hypothetical protein
MKNIEKTLLVSFLLVILTIISCKNSNTNNDTQIHKNYSKNKLDKKITDIIANYYQEKYGQGNRMEKIVNDSILEYTYYNIPKETDEYDGHLISILIPIKNQNLFGSNSILHGDINNDNKDELIVTVHTEGGGTGGNIYSQDIFVFILKNNNYELVNVTGDNEISGCTGDFRISKIENNLIVGHSSCYTENDARCCPSEFFETKILFKNNKLKCGEKRKINAAANRVDGSASRC